MFYRNFQVTIWVLKESKVKLSEEAKQLTNKETDRKNQLQSGKPIVGPTEK